MKPRITFLIVALSLGALSCGDSSNLAQDGVLRAEVIKLIPPGPDNDPSLAPRFEVSTGNFYNLTSFKDLSGPYFNLVHGGEIRISDFEGSIVSSNGFIGGDRPRLRYHVVNSVVIPDDNETLLMLSSYYQFELIAQSLEKFSGISMNEIRHKKGSIRILFYPSIRLENKALSSRIVFKTNAAFEPQQCQFLIMPGSEAEDIPLSGNLQVLAHEFGHLIFQYTLGNPQNPEDHKDAIYKTEVFKGLNEGFADFFSYSLIGSTDILGGSLGWWEEISKERNFSKISFNYSQVNSGISGECQGSFYCLGTLFAKSLFMAKRNSVFSREVEEHRAGFLRQVIQALSKAKEKLDQESVIQALRAREKLWFQPIIQEPQKEKVLGAFLYSFMSSIEDTDIRRSVYSAVVHNFGSAGFTEDYRKRLYGSVQQ